MCKPASANVMNYSVDMCHNEPHGSASDTTQSSPYDISQFLKVGNTTPIPKGTMESDLFFLYPRERSIFSAVYLLFYIIAFIGNIAAIIITIKRKQRCIQKTCIISLASSDLITATAMTVMYMSVFTQSIIIWILGPFLCSFLPAVPVFGVICSSAALVGIALDRYWNVVHALKKRWNPALSKCLVSVAGLWIIAAALSYPMFTYFSHVIVYVVYFDHTNTIPLKLEKEYMCISFKKDELKDYYISLMVVVFVPLICIFLGLYIQLALLVWRHRKPLSSIFRKKMETSTTAEASTSQTRITEECSRTTVTSDLNLKRVVKSKNMRAERKIRTFKIIVFLMCAFTVLRLPIIIFDTVKVSKPATTHAAWLAKYTCTALTLLNCALNPFLYAFLNKTLEIFTKIIRTLKDFICEVCCCCFSTTEFQEFENENPFIRSPFEKQPRGSDSSLSKKSNPKSSRVQFEELPAIKLYAPEGNLPKENYKEVKKY